MVYVYGIIQPRLMFNLNDLYSLELKLILKNKPKTPVV